MFKKNLEKLIEIQSKAVDIICDQKRIVLNWETGVGKTLPALQSAELLKGKWLWVMSQNIQERNVIKEMLHFKINADITFVNYKSVKQHEGRNYKGVILDEAHRITEISSKSIKKINSEYFIALSASVPDDRLKLLKKTIDFQKVLKVTMKQAIKYGIIPPVNIIGVEIDMKDDTELRNVYIKRYNYKDSAYVFNSVKDYKENINKIWPEHFYVNNCTLAQHIEVIENEMEYWKQQYLKHYNDPKFRWMKDTKWLPLGALRKNILADYKNRFIPIVQEHLNGKRYIVFNESISQINTNTETVDSTAIHSKIKKVDNIEAIDSFNRGETDVLQVAKMLNEGMNLTNIDAIVILALASNDIQNIQRRGRSTRSITPTVYVLYVKDSKDQENFLKFVEDYIDTTRIIKINQLKDYESTN